MEHSAARARWTVLIFAVVGLGVVGLALQMAASWSSVIGDAVWAACGLAFAAAASVDPHRRRTRRGLVSTTALVLFGLSVAFLMVYWILVDAGQIDRIDFVSAVPIGLGAIGLATSVKPRQPRRGR